MSNEDLTDSVTIKITKTEFSWHLDIEGQGLDGSGGTSPTFAGAYDMAYSIIVGGDKNNWDINPWTQFDANDRKTND